MREKRGRCQVELFVDGRRHRISTEDAYNPGNVKRWQSRLRAIEHRVNSGRFVWEDEFPQYKHLQQVAPQRAEVARAQTYDAVADAWEATLTEPVYAWSSIYSYKRINRSRWRPLLGKRSIAEIGAGELETLVAKQAFSTEKTYNNALMVLKCVFQHATRMKPPLLARAENPVEGLEYLKLHSVVDPRMVYDLRSAEFLIEELRKDWGDPWGNYFEFSFFGGGMRPSEQVALEWRDLDLESGKILVERARVMGRAKKKPKNGPKRWVKLAPRALAILERQRALTGKLDHGRIFAHDDGTPIHDRESPWKRWSKTHARLTKADQAFFSRPPYAARHSSVTWHLMMGRSDRWVARQHGHSVQVMQKVYAHWLEDADEDEGERFGPRALELRRAFGYPLPPQPGHLAPHWHQAAANAPAHERKSA